MTSLRTFRQLMQKVGVDKDKENLLLKNLLEGTLGVIEDRRNTGMTDKDLSSEVLGQLLTFVNDLTPVIDAMIDRQKRMEDELSTLKAFRATVAETLSEAKKRKRH